MTVIWEALKYFPYILASTIMGWLPPLLKFRTWFTLPNGVESLCLKCLFCLLHSARAKTPFYGRHQACIVGWIMTVAIGKVDGMWSGSEHSSWEEHAILQGTLVGYCANPHISPLHSSRIPRHDGWTKWYLGSIEIKENLTHHSKFWKGFRIARSDIWKWVWEWRDHRVCEDMCQGTEGCLDPR